MVAGCRRGKEGGLQTEKTTDEGERMSPLRGCRGRTSTHLWTTKGNGPPAVANCKPCDVSQVCMHVRYREREEEEGGREREGGVRKARADRQTRKQVSRASRWSKGRVRGRVWGRVGLDCRKTQARTCSPHSDPRDPPSRCCQSTDDDTR